MDGGWCAAGEGGVVAADNDSKTSDLDASFRQKRTSFCLLCERVKRSDLVQARADDRALPSLERPRCSLSLSLSSLPTSTTRTPSMEEQQGVHPTCSDHSSTTADCFATCDEQLHLAIAIPHQTNSSSSLVTVISSTRMTSSSLVKHSFLSSPSPLSNSSHSQQKSAQKQLGAVRVSSPASELADTFTQLLPLPPFQSPQSQLAHLSLSPPQLSRRSIDRNSRNEK